jgi:glyoxylate reductase
MSKIVVTGRIPKVAVEKLQAEHEVDAWSVDESMSRDELLSRVVGADALVTLLTERSTRNCWTRPGPSSGWSPTLRWGTTTSTCRRASNVAW